MWTLVFKLSLYSWHYQMFPWEADGSILQNSAEIHEIFSRRKKNRIKFELSSRWWSMVPLITRRNTKHVAKHVLEVKCTKLESKFPRNLFGFTWTWIEAHKQYLTFTFVMWFPIFLSLLSTPSLPYYITTENSKNFLHLLKIKKKKRVC